MRVGVIRGDLPSPVFVSDLEPTSQPNVPTEAPGQTRYISRPSVATVGPFIATVSASVASTGAISFPVTINGGNHALKLKKELADSYTVYTVPAGTYANIAALVTAVNSALLNSPFQARALSATKLALMTVAMGEGQRIQYDATAAGSTFNTPAALAAGGASHTVPSAGSFILSVSPVGGPLNVSTATIRSSLGGGLSDAWVEAAADHIAPKFVESNTALESFLVGELSALRSASFNPDTSRWPPLATGAAISIVQDDGVTPFVTAKPTLTNAQFNVPAAGAVTLTGVSLAGMGLPNAEVEETKVGFYTPWGVKTVTQFVILRAGGKVSATSIILPASVVPAGVTSGVEVQVQYKSFVSNKFTLV